MSGLPRTDVGPKAPDSFDDYFHGIFPVGWVVFNFYCLNQIVWVVFLCFKMTSIKQFEEICPMVGTLASKATVSIEKEAKG